MDPMRRAVILMTAATIAVAGCGQHTAGKAAAGKAPVADAPESLARNLGDTIPYVVVSPDGGAVWREGETHTIRWIAHRGDSVNIGATMGGHDKGHLAFGLPPGSDSLRWTIPAGFVTGFGIRRADDIRIHIEDAADPRIDVPSAPFTIAGP
jgi:hypothetical protein